MKKKDELEMPVAARLLPGMCKVFCPLCHLPMQAQPGMNVRCPNCKHMFRVPGGEAEQAQPSPPPAARTRLGSAPARTFQAPKQIKTAADFSIVLPSQEHMFEVMVLENPTTKVLGANFQNGQNAVAMLLKCTPAYISILSTVGEGRGGGG